ncbi:MAG TPA: hypothetical protein VG164_07770 [Trebonia sp.]|nr:hypothetical protein [Trebonia sp.]
MQGARDRLTAYWGSPAGRVMALATLLALAIRIFTLSRAGYLTGITEYDDGVYLGGAIRLSEGVIPYRDFAFVQPPGILLLMTPVAFVANVTTAVKGLALARLLTALASAACVPLAGNLVKYRGTVVTLVTCALLAIYPDDITTAHTLMLEPWMNLLTLLGVNAAVRRGRLASPRRLVWAGLALGFAGTVKFWAAAPAAALLALCLLTRDRRAARLGGYLPAAAAGFIVPVAPFLLSAPMAFIRSTISDQAARTGSTVPFFIRLANLTGVVDVVNSHGHIELDPGPGSMLTSGPAAAVSATSTVGWLPYVVAVLAVGVIVAGYLVQSRRLTHLEWLALLTTILSAAAILGYSAFFYHYADFPAPWLAITAGSAAGALAGRAASRKLVVRVVAVLAVLVAVMQAKEMYPSHEPTAEAIAHQIPKGSCVVADEVSLSIAADRFTALPPGCPVIIDSLAATLVLSDGVSVQGGASQMPFVVSQWKKWLGAADYVWLSPGHGSKRRIPWTPALSAWFNTTFEKVGTYSSGTGQLYKRVTG